ncbi:hypothetical protein N657DRAFT_281959 [Parathielavia appendiculata]|uniref:Uncharacterized protein n=1 Tax=Parathielavia appendiculata TaxID=2587402 RepID=A0AAN6Z5K7_9PEZI|nr:hypothetical protein N657DRAFT_281959 [Parathielavia appendiculata]
MLGLSIISPFAQVAGQDPNRLPVISRLATVCDDYPPGSTAPPLVFTTVGTRTGNGFGFPSATRTSSTTSSVSTTSEAAAANASTSSSTALAARGVAVPGALAWFANLGSFILSLFILL